MSESETRGWRAPMPREGRNYPYNCWWVAGEILARARHEIRDLFPEEYAKWDDNNVRERELQISVIVPTKIQPYK